MKTFAHVEQNLNAAGQKHTKKGKEGRVKSEVHERFVRRPLVVEEREGEILGLARQVKELQAKLKHLRSLAQRKVMIQFLLAILTMRLRLLKHLAPWRERDASSVDCDH